MTLFYTYSIHDTVVMMYLYTWCGRKLSGLFGVLPRRRSYFIPGMYNMLYHTLLGTFSFPYYITRIKYHSVAGTRYQVVCCISSYTDTYNIYLVY